MNATTETRDPSDLEREASAIRADMDRTLDALERKFSPGQMLDRSVGYLRDHGGDLARNIGETVKQNPIPVLLTTAGLAWLITSSIRSRSGYSADLYGDPYGDDYSAEPGLKEKVTSKLQAGAEAVSQKFHAGTDAAQRTWRSSRSAASGRVSRAMDVTRERAQQVQQRAHGMLEEQPLVLGALAVAAGAIIGAALPTTQYENRTVGRVRDRTLDKAKEAGEREYQNLRTKLESRQDTQVSGRAN
jgi:hypothetical protein